MKYFLSKLKLGRTGHCYISLIRLSFLNHLIMNILKGIFLKIWIIGWIKKKEPIAYSRTTNSFFINFTNISNLPLCSTIYANNCWMWNLRPIFFYKARNTIKWSLQIGLNPEYTQTRLVLKIQELTWNIHPKTKILDLNENLWILKKKFLK